ncbi:MAG: hypothetical protein IPK59_14390 [Rhodospirillaceae bacterium]|nr:hypothetical protein [Rhodospirillaceae bacterium]
MTARAHILIFLLYALAAVVLAFWLPEFLPSVSPILGAIAGGFVVMAGALLHQAALAKGHHRVQAQSLGDLNRMLTDILRDQRKLEDDMLQLRATLANLATSPQQDVGDVVNEVKVLQTLIEQLYTARTGAPNKVAAKAAVKPAVAAPKAASPAPASASPGIAATTPPNAAMPSAPAMPRIAGRRQRQPADATHRL